MTEISIIEKNDQKIDLIREIRIKIRNNNKINNI